VTCSACGIAIVIHSLDQSRACLTKIAASEPSYCRLTGPSDPGAWSRAVAARTLDQITHPERYEI